MFNQLTIVLFVLFVGLWRTSGQFVDHSFPLEDTHSGYWLWRSNAEDLKTLRLDRPGRKYVNLALCPTAENPNRRVVGRIFNIRYSNDGDSDNVTITLNGRQIGRFETIPYSNWGHQWNVFHNTNRVGRNFPLINGRRYQLTITAQTDFYGVELDQINIQARNQRPGVDLICGAQLGAA